MNADKTSRDAPRVYARPLRLLDTETVADLPNVDRTAGLEHLGGFPLARYRTELTKFYEDMAQRDPASWVPAAALEKLRR